MPTGYTSDVQDGKLTELRDFALRCARAFGALIMMRDDPSDAPIPDEFKPSEFYTQRALQLADEIGNLEALTSAECLARQNEEIAKARGYRDEYLAEREVKRGRYEAMLVKVHAWEAPTADHAGLKRFMVEQLTDSIKFDCGSYEPEVPPVRDPHQWRDEKVASLKKDLARARAHLSEEKSRAEERTAWVKALKASL
jgi:hypothetical protein